MRAIAYYRVSSESQRDNTSLENQKSQVRKYAQLRDIQIVKEFQDVASGGDTHRNGFLKAIEYLRTNEKDLEVFMVFKYDRAHRNLKETLIFVDELNALKIEYISVSQDIDTTTPQGKLFFQIVCSFAEFEKEIIRERCRDGRKAKIEKQQTPGGRPALGYDKDWKVDPREAEVVRDLFRQYLKLKSLGRLAGYARAQGYCKVVGLNLTRYTLRDMLRNRAYLGEFSYNGSEEKHGVFWKDHHETIIANTVFGKVQALMSRNCKCKSQVPNEK